MGFLEALSWIKDLGFERVTFETDAKLVYDVLNSSLDEDTVFGNVITSCKTILQNLPLFKINLAPRDANTVAYRLTRNARNFASPFCWVQPPSLWRALPISIVFANKIYFSFKKYKNKIMT